MLYNEPLYRPPSEANSAIVQVTLGCSWNQCLFCDMYHEKRFRLVPLQEVENDLRTLSEYMPEARKLFLADGDAFVLSYDKLRPILELAHSYFPALHRISAYALPRDIASKSPAELQAFWLEIRYRDACYWRNASWRQHLSYLSVFRYSRQGVIDERR